MLKLGFAFAVVGPAAIVLVRVARPGGERSTPTVVLALPFAAISVSR
jgi:hypothetical protein